MRLIIFSICLGLALTGCADDRNNFGATGGAPARQLELTGKERHELLADSELFQAVWNNQLEQVDQILKRDPAQMDIKNANGDTALALAIQSGYLSIAKRILVDIPAQELQEKNAKGEGYILLAAEAGVPEVIRAVANKYYDSLGSGGWFGIGKGYSFSDLDFPDNEGQRALFVAADRRVAEALEAEYYRGFYNRPLWKFTLATDGKERTFLHEAAELGHVDVILWANEKLCAPMEWETSETWWKNWIANAGTTVTNELQTYSFLGRVSVPNAVMFNHQDSDGQTPIQVAIRNRQWQALRALGSCRWIDYDLAGELPLQDFLNGLNPMRAQNSPDVYAAFDFLVAQNTLARRLQYTVKSRIDRTNAKKETAMHLAARLADPTFYNKMASLGGDVFALDMNSERPDQIFQRTHKEKGQHAH